MIHLKRILVGIFACFVLIGMAGCDQTLENRMDAAYQKLNEAQSYETTVTFGLIFSVASQEYEIPLAIELSVDMTVFMEPMEIKYVVSANVLGYTETISEMYLQQMEDGSGVWYIYEPIEGIWIKQAMNQQEMGSLFMNADIPYENLSELLTSPKIVRTDVIDGVTMDVVESNLNIDLIWDAIMEEIDSEGGLFLSGADMALLEKDIRAVLETVTCRIWIDQTAPDIYRIKLDLSGLNEWINEALDSDMVQDLLGAYGLEDMPEDVEMSVSDLYIEAEYGNVNQAEPYEIPNDAFGSGII